MRKANKVCRPRILKDRRAASPAVSMVIITAVTVVMVIVASNYALQYLTRQQAVAEFGTTQDSILAFDDALRDIAWDPEGSRSILFRTQYGSMVLKDNYNSYTISASGLNDTFNYQFKTAAVRYQIPYGYGISGSGSSYILGDDRTVVNKLTDSLSQVLLDYGSELASITLNYRVRVSEQGQTMVNGATYNYIDIFVTRIKCNSTAIDATDFSLICKNVGLRTESVATYSGQSSTIFTITDTNNARISVMDNASAFNADSIDLVKDLNLKSGDNVIFNLIVSDVRVST